MTINCLKIRSSVPRYILLFEIGFLRDKTLKVKRPSARCDDDVTCESLQLYPKEN